MRDLLVDAEELTPALQTAFPGVVFGSHVHVGRNIRIRPGTVIGCHVVLHDDSEIGSNVRIDDGCVIGKLPLRSRQSAVTRVTDLPPALIGDGALIGTHAIIYRGAAVGAGVLIADLATVREETTIGDLTIIGRGVAIENQVSVGTRCKIETGAYITAKSTIADLCFVAPEATFTNDNYVGRTQERLHHFAGVTMKRGARVGANATVLPGLVLGEDALVAAGSVVTRDVPPGMVVMGAPARVIRAVAPEQLLNAQAGAQPGKEGR